MLVCCVFYTAVQVVTNLHHGVIIHLHGALMMDEAAVIVIVTAIVKDIGAGNETVVDEGDQNTGHRRRVIVTKAGRGEGVYCRNWN